MNIKNSIFALLINFTPFTMHSMEKRTSEQNLFSKKISPQKYLLEIEHGLYGNNLAQQLNEIHSTIYNSSKRKIKNLYQILINLIKFTLKNKDAYNPDNIKTLMTNQIHIKYKTLHAYKENGLVQISSMSQEDFGQLPSVSGE